MYCEQLYTEHHVSVFQLYWTVNSPMQNTIIHLVEQIVGALGTEIKVYLPQIIPHCLRVFMHDVSAGRLVTAKVRVYYMRTCCYLNAGPQFKRC